MTRLSRPSRRLIVAVLVLLAVDLVEPGILRQLETARYEDPAIDFRFENSDLFGVGPLVEYLRENPAGRQPRVMFLGNSVTYGYTLTAAEALPAQYQRLDRVEKVFNVGVNGFDVLSAYLVAKAAIASVEHVYVLCRVEGDANPMIGRRVPVDDDDARRFDVPAANRVETALSRVAERWALYRDTYRLQAALFGTSSRQYVYLNKGRMVRGVFAALHAQSGDARGGEDAAATAPMADTIPDAQRLAAIRAASPGTGTIWHFADLFRDRRKHVAMLYVRGFSEWLPDARSVADFNRAYFPYARIVVLDLPQSLLSDGMHLTAPGAAAAARALWRERQAFEAAAR